MSAKEKLEELAAKAGAAGGSGALGALIGGQVAGAGGAAVAGLASYGIVEAVDRLLSRRQARRTMVALDAAAEEISHRLDAGEQPRGDLGNAEVGEEVLDAVLVAVQREPQERKVAYLGRLWASICFDPDITSGNAHALIAVAEQLSWRQYVLLAGLRRVHWLWEPTAKSLGLEVGDQHDYTLKYVDFLGAERLGAIRRRTQYDHELRKEVPTRNFELAGLGRELVDRMRLDSITGTTIKATWPRYFEHVSD